MGAIGNAIMAYAQPLLGPGHDSPADLEKALGIAQICWNLALLPENERDGAIAALRSSLGMETDRFEEFRESIILPMIRRHHEMFPDMSPLGAKNHSDEPPATRTRQDWSPPVGKYPGTPRNALCPCMSGRKYKRCCGR